MSGREARPVPDHAFGRRIAGFGSAEALVHATWAVLCAAGGLFALERFWPEKPMREPQDFAIPPQPGDAPDAARRQGRFGTARAAADDEQALLESLGYVSGSREAGAASGVVLHDPGRAWQGLNLYTSGHANEALLVDMDGRVLHTWRKDWHEVVPKANPRNPNVGFWRRAVPLEDGRLLAILEGIALVLLDRESNVLWVSSVRAHHDLHVLPDGTMWALTRKLRGDDDINRRKPLVDDHATLLAADGTVLKEVSLMDAWRASPYVAGHPKPGDGGDLYHTNAIEPVAGPPFLPGHLLLSVRNKDLLAVLDPDAGRIVWAAQGSWRRQHDPHQLPDGQLALFDNATGAGRSRVLRVDPTTLAETVVLEGTPDEPFYSATCGTVQPLPNGNLLVTESDAGRAFERTPDGAVVWDFHNPHRPPDDPTLVATLFDVLRLPPDFGAGWLRR